MRENVQAFPVGLLECGPATYGEGDYESNWQTTINSVMGSNRLGCFWAWYNQSLGTPGETTNDLLNDPENTPLTLTSDYGAKVSAWVTIANYLIPWEAETLGEAESISNLLYDAAILMRHLKPAVQSKRP